MLQLPGVTLCAIDTRTPELALWSLACSQRDIAFGQVILFTDRDLPAGPEGCEVVQIPRLGSSSAYSMFVLHDLHRHIRTPHVLITQWDSFVADAQAWDADFLNWDYIGAPWPNKPPGREVGNGGFSLRSLRLMRTLAGSGLSLTHPEDECICLTHADELAARYGLRIAPTEVAARFAFENLHYDHPSLGFHGCFNFPYVLSDAELADTLRRLPDEVLVGDDGWKLTRRLTKMKKWHLARLALQRHIVGRKRLPRARAHLLFLTLRDWYARLFAA